MRKRVLNLLRYEESGWLPVVHFGFWDQLYDKWEAEGHIPGPGERKELGRGSGERMVAEKLGFDIGWAEGVHPSCGLDPGFQWEILQTFPDGSRHVRQADGVTVMDHPGVLSIPSEVDHLLKDRASWEEHYLPRLQWFPERITEEDLAVFGMGDRAELQALGAGSIIGWARNWVGIEGLSYMLADDPDLVKEIVDTVGGLILRMVEENIMFPIEVGTWAASIAPWREKYGREIRGVGGMDKRVFAADRAAVDAEINRIKPLVELGGYIPCPDHRIPLEAEWDLVRYYCDRMKKTFGR